MKKINYDVDEYGHQRLGGIGYRVAREIEQRTGFETRETTPVSYTHLTLPTSDLV